MEAAHGNHKGAVGLSVNGRDEMIDAPMLRQVRVLNPIPRNSFFIANIAFVAVIGATNHSTRKAGRVTHLALQLTNVSIGILVSRANMGAGCREETGTAHRVQPNSSIGMFSGFRATVSRPLVARASNPLGHFSFPLCQLLEVCRLVVMRCNCRLISASVYGCTAITRRKP